MKKKNATLTLILATFCTFSLYSQNEPIIIEAESGTVGADFSTLNDGGVDYVTIQTNLAGDSPGSADRVISYSVTFPEAGTYALFGRLRVGPSTYDDDSYFYGNGFGAKDVSNGNDWILGNGLAAAGFTDPDDLVSGIGGAANGIWKWVNFADFDGGEPPITFTVESGALTQTFEIGAREDGLDIDKFAFARADYYYTVSNLDNAEPGSPEPPDPNEPEGPPLADGQAKFLGNVYSTAQLPYFEFYWNQVSPENAGKWGSVEGTRNNMNWGGLDNAYNLAKDNDFFYRHHNLIWGNQQPTWIAALDSAEQYAEISEWFSELAARYDSIDQVEVVNEPLHDPPDDPEDGGYIGALGGSGVTGWDWIINAFRLARTHFPDAELIINDYNIVGSLESTEDYIEIIELLQAEDTLIDGIGVQGHAFSTFWASSTTLSDNLDLLAATGLPIYVTEMDIDGLEDDVQLHEYQRVFPIFWEHPAVAGITFWGYRPGMWRTAQGAYLLRSDGSERPSMVWLRAYIAGNVVDVSSVAVSSTGGVTSIDVDDGTLQMLAEVLPIDATVKDVKWTISDQDLASIDDDGLLTAIDNGTVRVTATAIDGSGEQDYMDIELTNQLPNGMDNINSEVEFCIYPNPSSDGKFVIEGLENLSDIKVMDLSGQVLTELKVTYESSVEVQLDVASGIYVIQLYDGEETYHKKIVVK